MPEPIPASLLEGLNPEQRSAVEALEGPVLIIAGPGSGKTRVLTHRMAALLATGRARPEQILAVTFTNRAAAEMRERVIALVGPDARRIWVVTFHAACVRVLRAHAAELGLSTAFAIVDASDARSLIARVIEDATPGQPLDKDRVREAQHRISLAKNADQSPDDVARHSEHGWVAEVMAAYDRRLRAMGALDFDDLLLYTLRLLARRPEVTAQWRQRFRHIMVDEFQDTNVVQYRIVRLLATGADSLCVVGDPDQSIYAWRGATPEVVQAFREDEPTCQTVVLDRNYRSTPAILRTVQSIIDANPSPQRAHLRTDNPETSPVRVIVAPSNRDEARVVVTEIQRRLREDPQSGQYAILMRTNFQTRGFEEELTRTGLPYQVLGALRFYDRAEVKDALAYLRVALNRSDRISLARCLNTPRRGLGPTTQAAILEAVDPWELARTASSGEALSLNRTQRPALAEFLDLIDAIEAAAATSPADALRLATQRSGLRAMYAEQKLGGAERVDNLDELVRAADDFARSYLERPDAEPDTPFAASLAFIENVTLVSANDDDTTRADVVLLSAHASKGKEFNHVYVTGVEEGLFPHQRALGASGIQEERRLLFVAASRARQTLTFTRCAERYMFGEVKEVMASRFLHALPDDVETLSSDEILHPRTRSFGSGSFAAPSRGGFSGSSRSNPGYARPRPGYASNPHSNPRPAPRPRPLTATTVRPEAPAPPPTSGPRLRATDLSVGERVVHGAYGAGVVIEVRSRDETAVIDFPAGRKTLSLAYAPLKRP